MNPFLEFFCSYLRSLSCLNWLLQLGGFFIWTYTYQLIRTSSKKLKALQAAEEISKTPNNNLDADVETHLLKGEDQEHVAISESSIKSIEDSENQIVTPLMYHIM
jgi:hypothetical protein